MLDSCWGVGYDRNEFRALYNFRIDIADRHVG